MYDTAKCSRQLEFGLLTIGRIRNTGGMLQNADGLRATRPKPGTRKCRAGRRGTGSAQCQMQPGNRFHGKQSRPRDQSQNHGEDPRAHGSKGPGHERLNRQGQMHHKTGQQTAGKEAKAWHPVAPQVDEQGLVRWTDGRQAVPTRAVRPQEKLLYVKGGAVWQSGPCIGRTGMQRRCHRYI